ncbi:unnamed protein product, partial [Polarella glacialis]
MLSGGRGRGPPVQGGFGGSLEDAFPSRQPGGGALVPRGGSAGRQLQTNQMGSNQMVQAFSGGVSRSERALVAGTDGSVAEVEANILQAVRTFGAPPGAKKMMDAERLAAEEAMRTGLYGIWRNASSSHDFCGRIGPMSRCFCGHDYGAHAWSKGRKEPRPKCGSCGCPGFRYIPRRPEEVGEWWLPRRRGFDVRLWRANCKCGHSHEEHDSSSLRCRGCGCPSFSSAWECVSCEGKWQDHETLWESEEERRHCGRSVGQAFMPLSSTPE